MLNLLRRLKKPNLLVSYLLATLCSFPVLAETSEDHLFGMVRGISFKGHEGTVHCVAFLRGQKHRLVSIGDDDKSVKLWDPVAGQLLSSLEFGYRPLDMIVSRDGKRLDVLLSYGSIRRIRVADDTLEDTTSVQDWVGGYGRIAASPNETFFAAVSRDEDVSIWNAKTQRHHQSYLGTIDFRAITFTESNQEIIAVDKDTRVVMWDILANEGFGARESFDYPGDPYGKTPMDMSFHTTTRRLAMTHMDGHVSLWNVGEGLSVVHERTMRLPKTTFEPMFSPKGELLYVPCLDGNVYLFETETGKIAKGFQGSSAGLYSISMNHHHNLLAAGNLDGEIIVWWTPQ